MEWYVAHFDQNDITYPALWGTQGRVLTSRIHQSGSIMQPCMQCQFRECRWRNQAVRV